MNDLGTNFYTLRGKHIGKRSSAGNGEMLFTTATTDGKPIDIRKLRMVENEYGERIYIEEFMSMIKQCKYHKCLEGKFS